ncbi:hypothetical protein [Paraburkholderia humisilvae]|uniref:Uncharacterized protein n=1 Tax=Paraburkholderia humisilvae TaxID=627669 RepID=A0A6J5DK45_9BURK|nr:hypothetical protein [Paraburkholderia humisilvae]CAB3754448.1 hypothetical protein LMG29542_02355 [Paraburkholderia humisilvae]
MSELERRAYDAMYQAFCRLRQFFRLPRVAGNRRAFRQRISERKGVKEMKSSAKFSIGAISAAVAFGACAAASAQGVTGNNPVMNEVKIGGSATIGSSCSTNWSIASDATGGILECRGKKWVPPVAQDMPATSSKL